VEPLTLLFILFHFVELEMLPMAFKR